MILSQKSYNLPVLKMIVFECAFVSEKIEKCLLIATSVCKANIRTKSFYFVTNFIFFIFCLLINHANLLTSLASTKFAFFQQ